jgi:hypothetical protein
MPTARPYVQVAALDEGGGPAPNGSRVVQTAQGGALDANGPPTTLSDRAKDRLMFVQVLPGVHSEPHSEPQA